jgi:hypothetical protein
MKTSSILLPAIASAVLTSAPFASAATVKYTATLNAAQTTPAGTSTATGSADLDFDDQSRELRGTITLTLPPDTKVTNQHVHRGKCGESGSIVKTLPSPGNDIIYIDGFDPVKLDADQAAALESGQMYIDIHTDKNVGGEMRGQIYKQGATETCPASTGDGGGASSSGAPAGDGGPAAAPATDDGGGCSTSGAGGGGLGLALGIAIALVAARRSRRR